MNYHPLDRPERIPEVFVQAWNERDARTLASVFDEDAEFVAHRARPMVAIVAVMRKLVHSIYGVFKHDQASDGEVLPHSPPEPRCTRERFPCD